MAILVRDLARCVYCGRSPMDRGCAGLELRADHLTPTTWQGEDVAENLVTACLGCNGDKHHMHLATYLVHLANTRRGARVKEVQARVAAALAHPVDWNRARAALQQDVAAQRKKRT